MTLEEFFQSSKDMRLLWQNLITNERVYIGDVDWKTRDQLMRANLIMIRQCLEDCGFKPDTGRE